MSVEQDNTPLPPSLAVSPNIAWEDQTIEQLEAERDYWLKRESASVGPASGVAAYNFRIACEKWIARRRQEKTA